MSGRLPSLLSTLSIKQPTTGAAWVDATNGDVPPGAVVGCTNNWGQIFVARAEHKGVMLPGKLIPGQYCIVFWWGKPLNKDKYQVLCNAGEAWQTVQDGSPLPPSALPIGFLKNRGVLHVGRVHVAGEIIVGQVGSKDGHCWVYMQGREQKVPRFEVLTVSELVQCALASNTIIPRANNGPLLANGPATQGGPCKKNNNKKKFNNKRQAWKNDKENNNNDTTDVNDQPQQAKPKTAENKQIEVKKNIHKKTNDSEGSCEAKPKIIEKKQVEFKRKIRPSLVQPDDEPVEPRDLALEALLKTAANEFDEKHKNDKPFSQNEKLEPPMPCKKKEIPRQVSFLDDVPQRPKRKSQPTKPINITQLLGTPKIPSVKMVPRISTEREVNDFVVVDEAEELRESADEEGEGDEEEQKWTWLRSLLPAFPWPCSQQQSPVVQPPANRGGSQGEWVSCSNGVVAQGAVQGGKNHSGAVYVARAEHQGALIPGKLIPSFKICYVGSDGEEFRKDVYEVLCGVSAKWLNMSPSSSVLPDNVVTGGYNEHGEPLYVGRVRSSNYLMLGKVEEVDGAWHCVALQERREIKYDNFEILTSGGGVTVTELPDEEVDSEPVRRPSIHPRPRPDPEHPTNHAQPRPGLERAAWHGDEPSREWEARRGGQHDRRASKQRPVIEPAVLVGSPRQTQVVGVPGRWKAGQPEHVPSTAVVGGSNHVGDVLVARTTVAGITIPGKLIPQFGYCYVSNNGVEVKSRDYEILCDSNAGWQKMDSSIDPLPTNAILGGTNASNEPLFIGRVSHQTQRGIRVTCGKVEGGVCLVLFDGQEISFPQFDILVSSPRLARHGNSRVAARPLHTTPPAGLANVALALRDQRQPQSFRQPPGSSVPRPVPRVKIDQGLTLVPLSPTDQDYTYVSDKMQKSIKSHAGITLTSYTIIKIEKVSNGVIFERYQHCLKHIKAQNGGEANERHLFHGSPKCGDILKDGFDERHSSTNGMFGAGVYFAKHSSKSNQYAFGLGRGCTIHGNTSCQTCERQMMLCKVILGKISEHTTSQKFAHAPPNHHSVKGTPGAGLNYPEYIIYRGEQANPRFLITYKIQ